MPSEVSAYRKELIEKYIDPHNEQIARTGDIADRVFLEKLLLLAFLVVFTIAANYKFFVNELDWITLAATIGLDATAIKVKWKDFRDLYLFKFRTMTKLRRTSDMFKSLLSGLDEEGIRKTNTVKKLQKYSAITRIIAALEPWLDKEYPTRVDGLYKKCKAILEIPLDDPDFDGKLAAT